MHGSKCQAKGSINEIIEVGRVKLGRTVGNLYTLGSLGIAQTDKKVIENRLGWSDLLQ